MKFKEILLQGTLIKRYKRFFIDIKYKNKTLIIAHCPNSGSMMGFVKSKVIKFIFLKRKIPMRKLKYTALEIIEDKKELR